MINDKMYLVFLWNEQTKVHSKRPTLCYYSEINNVWISIESEKCFTKNIKDSYSIVETPNLSKSSYTFKISDKEGGIPVVIKGYDFKNSGVAHWLCSVFCGKYPINKYNYEFLWD